MIVVFNKKGITKEQLDSYGNLPRVGSQAFQIFAYFDGVELSNYGSAYIKLYRPDFSGSAYPILFMTLADLTFHSSMNVSSNYLHDGQTYKGFLFDFSKVKDTKGTASLDDDTIVTLLDTPGQWRAVITLVSKTKVSNVVGSVSFNVGGVPIDEDETEIDLDIVISTLADAVAGKLDSNSEFYGRVVSNFVTKAESGQLPVLYFTPGSVIFDDVNKHFYKINTVTLNSNDEDYVFCTDYTVVGALNGDVDAYAETIEASADLTVPYRYNFSLKNGNDTVISTASIDLASQEVQADLEAYVNNAVVALKNQIENGTIQAAKTKFSDEFTRLDSTTLGPGTVHISVVPNPDYPNTILDFGLILQPSGFGSIYKSCRTESDEYILIRTAGMFNNSTLTIKKKSSSDSSFSDITSSVSIYAKTIS